MLVVRRTLEKGAVQATFMIMTLVRGSFEMRLSCDDL